MNQITQYLKEREEEFKSKYPSVEIRVIADNGYQTQEPAYKLLFNFNKETIATTLRMVRENVKNMILHTPLKIKETPGDRYHEGYIFYQDMVNAEIKEFYNNLQSLESSITSSDSENV